MALRRGGLMMYCFWLIEWNGIAMGFGEVEGRLRDKGGNMYN